MGSGGDTQMPLLEGFDTKSVGMPAAKKSIVVVHDFVVCSVRQMDDVLARKESLLFKPRVPILFKLGDKLFSQFSIVNVIIHQYRTTRFGLPPRYAIKDTRVVEARRHAALGRRFLPFQPFNQLAFQKRTQSQTSSILELAISSPSVHARLTFPLASRRDMFRSVAPCQRRRHARPPQRCRGYLRATRFFQSPGGFCDRSDAPSRPCRHHRHRPEHSRLRLQSRRPRPPPPACVMMPFWTAAR